MSSPREPWTPRVDELQEFNPFSSTGPDGDALLHSPKIRDPEKDTAPLQGSKDLSDSDSLNDVIADAADPSAVGESNSPDTTQEVTKP